MVGSAALWGDGMRIGELAARAGVSTAAIRFYERVGVVGRPARTGGGYRDYGAAALAEIEFVQAARSIGLTLAEIAEIVAFRDGAHGPCDELMALMERHLAEVERRIEELGRVRRDLRALLEAARLADPDDCTPEAVLRLLPAGAAHGRPSRPPRT